MAAEILRSRQDLVENLDEILRSRRDLGEFLAAEILRSRKFLAGEIAGQKLAEILAEISVTILQGKRQDKTRQDKLPFLFQHNNGQQEAID